MRDTQNSGGLSAFGFRLITSRFAGYFGDFKIINFNYFFINQIKKISVRGAFSLSLAIYFFPPRARREEKSFYVSNWLRLDIFIAYVESCFAHVISKKIFFKCMLKLMKTPRTFVIEAVGDNGKTRQENSLPNHRETNNDCEMSFAWILIAQ